jgi:hypothetical protein
VHSPITKALEMLPDYVDLRASAAAIEGPATSDFQIVFAGEFNAGKSMLINALLGRDLLKSSAIPTTARITYLRFGLQEYVCVKQHNGSDVSHPLKYLEQLTTTASADQHVDDTVTVFCNAALLSPHRVIVDTPGFGDDGAQTRQSQRALQAADLIVWVLRATDALGQRERQRAQNWLAENPGVMVAPVLNFMNIVSKGSEEVVRERVSGMLCTMLGRRADWVTALTGSPFFEIDIQSAMDRAIARAPQADTGFRSLSQFVVKMNPHDCQILKSRGHRARLERTLAGVRKQLEDRVARIRLQANAIRRAKDEHVRKRQAEERLLLSRAGACLATLESGASQQLAAELQNLIDSLAVVSLSSIEACIEAWAKQRLGGAYDSTRSAMELACTSLIAEFCGSKQNRSCVAFPEHQVGFYFFPPSHGFYDGLRNLAVLPPTEEYMSEAKSRVRVEWAKRSAEIITWLRAAVNLQYAYIWQVLKKQRAEEMAGISRGWSWSVADDFVSIKAYELWLRRGGPAPPTHHATVLSKVKMFVSGRQSSAAPDGPHPSDRDEAHRQLTSRVQAGEPLVSELLRCEMAITILESLNGAMQPDVVPNQSISTNRHSGVS